MRILSLIVASALLGQQESQAVQVKVLNQNRALAGTRTTSYAQNRAILGTMTLADCENEYQRSGYILADCEKFVQTGVVTQPVNNIQVTPPQLTTGLVQQAVPIGQQQVPRVLGQIRDQSQVPLADHLGQIPQPVQPPLQVLSQATITAPLQNPVTAMATPTVMPTLAQVPQQVAPVTGIMMAQTDQDSFESQGGTGQSLAQQNKLVISGIQEAKRAAEKKQELEHAQRLNQIAAQTPPPAPSPGPVPVANVMIQTESKMSQLVPVSTPMVAAQIAHPVQLHQQPPVSQVFGAPVAQAQVTSPAVTAPAAPVPAKTEAAQSDSTAAAQEKTESDADEGTTDTALAQDVDPNCQVTCCGCTSGDIGKNFLILLQDMVSFGEQQVKDDSVSEKIIKYVYVDGDGNIVPKPPSKPPTLIAKPSPLDEQCCCSCSCGCSLNGKCELDSKAVDDVDDIINDKSLSDIEKGKQIAAIVNDACGGSGGCGCGCCC